MKRYLLAAAIGVLCVPDGLFAQGPLTPPGAPAPAMKTLDQIEPRKPIDRLPATLSEPGAYVLTRNLSFGAGTGVLVTASDVTIDLNGFVLTGDPAGGGHGVHVVSGLANVTIRDGVLRGWGGDGVHAPATMEMPAPAACFIAWPEFPPRDGRVIVEVFTGRSSR